MGKKTSFLVAAPIVLAATVVYSAESGGPKVAVDMIQTFVEPMKLGQKTPDGISPESHLCLTDELTVSQLEEQLVRPLQDSILSGEKNPALGTVMGFSRAASPSRSRDGINEFDWQVERGSAMPQHLAYFSSLQGVDLKISDYSVDPKDRKGDKTFDRISLQLRLDLRGKNPSGKLAEDRALVRAQAVKKDGIWKLEAFQALRGKTLVLEREPSFKETTKVAGLDKATVYRRTEAIRRGGYALSIHDVNGDGVQDMFVGAKGAPELFLGRRDGTFARAEDSGFQNEMYTKTAVFADFLNRGKPSAVFTRYLDTKQHPLKGTSSPDVDVVFYRSQDGKFIADGHKFGGNPGLREPMPSAVADFNNDGFLDVYVGYPGKQDFSQLGSSEILPLHQVQGMYLNDGKGNFRDFKEASIQWNNEADYDGRLFPHSSLAADFNQDGKQDLMVVDDRGNLSPLFLNQGDGKFKESSGSLGLVNRGFSMSIAAGDLNNDGLTDVALTNVNLTEFDRMRSACARHVNGSVAPPLDQGLRIFLTGTNGKFMEATSDYLTDHPGEAPAGLTFLDYNNDGLTDLYVVNGLWSGSPKGQDVGSFFANLASKAWNIYALRSADRLHFMDLLSQFQGVIGNYADSSSVKAGTDRPSLGGYQRNRLYRNEGSGRFTEVGYLEGVDSIADGYMAARTDLNGDGKVDLVLRNADPGTDDYGFPVVQVYENQRRDVRNFVEITFQGTKSNRDAYGLFAKAFQGKSVQVQYLVANSGSVQEQSMLHFGLAQMTRLEKLEVHWPSGQVQVLKNLKAGHHHLVEPKLGGEIKIGVDAKPTKPQARK